MVKVLTRRFALLDVVFKQTTGVLGKDKSPFAPGTAWLVNTAGWKSPIAYTPISILRALADPATAVVEVIDEQNEMLTMQVRDIVPLPLEARRSVTG